ncbi:hypothetical protein MHU86_18693 [Fragilaria crotonensis]|nr:hypothetical protein MHU86_18693 [Fragilaria crotonensis]
MVQVMKPGFQNSNYYSASRAQSIPYLTGWDERQRIENQPNPQTPQFNDQLHQCHVPVIDEFHQKRVRGGKSEVMSAVCVTDESSLEEQQQCGKRSRGNSYRPPREVKQTVTSVMGSLVGGTFKQTLSEVKFRRQLSSSQLDQFMSQGDDKMDEDPTPIRERAMSF